MNWEIQQLLEENSNGMFIKVMTDDQLEILRNQIAAYATICQQLVDLHKFITSHNNDLSGVELGNLFCDPFLTSAGHKISNRQRWTPTPTQLQSLERIFDEGSGTPSKQKIKDMASDLSQHGQISETNVYNWFQNRRARSKRKQHVSESNNAESEVESPDGDKIKPDDFQAQHNYEDTDKVEPVFPSDMNSKLKGSLGKMSLNGSMLSNPRMDHLMGKLEEPGSYNSNFHGEEDYNMTGSQRYFNT